MKHHYGYSLSDLEDMIPFEFEIYVTHTRNYIQKLEEEKSRTSGGPSSSSMMKQVLARADAERGQQKKAS